MKNYKKKTELIQTIESLQKCLDKTKNLSDEKNHKILSSINDIASDAEQKLKQQNEEIAAQNEEYEQLNEKLRQSNQELFKAKEKIEKSHTKLDYLNLMLRLMCDNMPELIWAKDLQGKFMFANKSCCDDLLNAKDIYEPIGKTDIFFAEREKQLHPEKPNYHTFGETCTGSDKAVLETQKTIREDESGNIKGKFAVFNIIKSPFRDENGKLIGTVGCARDVTKERKFENKRKKTEKKLKKKMNELEIFNDAATDRELMINELRKEINELLTKSGTEPKYKIAE